MTHIYIASCTEDGGIYHYLLSKGRLTKEETLPLKHPMYMALSDGALYAVLKSPFEGSDESGVVHVRLNGGYFGAVSAPVGTAGSEGCHLCLAGGRVYVTNYASGSISRLPDITVKLSGSGPNPRRQGAPHPHSIVPTPDGRFLCAADLGTDRITVYDPLLRTVSEAALPPGCGPRHLIFSEDGEQLYCVNELISGLSVFGFKDGRLAYRGTLPVLPRDFEGENYPAAVRLYGGRIYVSNRGHDSVAYIDGRGEVGYVKTGGCYPRDFFIADSTLLCANERSDTVTVFDLVGGVPTETDTVLNIKRPLAIVGAELN